MEVDGNDGELYPLDSMSLSLRNAAPKCDLHRLETKGFVGLTRF